MTLPGLYVVRATTKYGLVVYTLPPGIPIGHPNYMIVKPTKVASLIRDGFLDVRNGIIGYTDQLELHVRHERERRVSCPREAGPYAYLVAMGECNRATGRDLCDDCQTTVII